MKNLSHGTQLAKSPNAFFGTPRKVSHSSKPKGFGTVNTGKFGKGSLSTGGKSMTMFK